MEKNNLKELFKDVANNNRLNITEKAEVLIAGVLLKGFAEPVRDGMEAIKNKTGVDVERIIISDPGKEKEERKNHSWKWAGKKLLWGTFKGVFSGTVGEIFHSNR